MNFLEEKTEYPCSDFLFSQKREAEFLSNYQLYIITYKCSDSKQCNYYVETLGNNPRQTDLTASEVEDSRQKHKPTVFTLLLPFLYFFLTFLHFTGV